MGHEYAIATSHTHADQELAAPGTPGKTTKTQGMKGSTAKQLLKKAKALYKQIRLTLKELSADGTPEIAQQLDRMFVDSKGLFNQFQGMRKEDGVDAEVEDLRFAVDRLYEEAAPILRRQGVTAETGVAVVDEGFACEGKPADGCYLDDSERERMWIALGVVVGSAMDNFRDALQNTMLNNRLKSSASAWGFWAEFLFYSVTGPLIGCAVKGLKKAKAAAGAAKATNDFWKGLGVTSVKDVGGFSSALSRVSDEDITATLQNASRGLRTHIKSAAHGGEGGDPGIDAFLKIIQGNIKELTDNTVLDAPARLNDVELVAMVQGYRDPVAHSISAYEAIVLDLVSRYEKQALDGINERYKDGGKQKPIYLQAYGKKRMGMLGDHGTGKIMTYGAGEARGETVYGTGEDFLIALVDDEMAPLALEMFGGTPKTIDISDGSYPFTPGPTKTELDAWVAQAKAEKENVQPIPAPTVTEIPAEDQAAHHAGELAESLDYLSLY